MPEPYWSTRNTAVIIYLGNMVAPYCQIDTYRTLCHRQGPLYVRNPRRRHSQVYHSWPSDFAEDRTPQSCYSCPVGAAGPG